ncbi:WecB/TagA/CpsF family glycosyltransferase [Actinomarinicola tropica]|uniref:WecB/TagA/CpsF family glycosyltransferase n=1 Tax=Actinomarinicola tropica TaxID=2789776 RepID=A0A5Q2RM18_9ACTN|nr:WecB/TagA/CpsF family glycosyltransferase [Actinomarinicola tropica]QGG95982.1 WecB/TagA/CpsF family glycosyltransferase [Actinomarinicola tropica]
MTLLDLPRRRLFGLDLVDAASVRPVADALLAWSPGDPLPPGAAPVVVTPNVDQLVHLDRGTDPVAASVARRAAVVLPDGQPIVWASPALGAPLSARLPGSTLVTELFPRLCADGRSVLVVATSEEVARRVEADAGAGAAVVAPRLSLDDRAGFDAFVAQVVELVASRRPEHVFVTLGFPKQCNIIDGVLRATPPERTPMLHAVGASFDMHYGLVRRAPEWMQRYGLEWFFRFLQEPRRLFRRYFVDDPAFLRILWRERRAHR